jgi:hypothetical protein
MPNSLRASYRSLAGSLVKPESRRNIGATSGAAVIQDHIWARKLQPDKLTTKQFGDACEHLILAELMLAKPEWQAHKMPDGWPGYDLSVANDTSGDIHIAVKGRRVGVGRTAKAWGFEPAGWHWLALVAINMDDGGRSIYMVPREWALANSYQLPQSGIRRIRIAAPALQRFRDNFKLDPDPDPRK